MKEMEELLKSAVPPWGETELRRDLWPEMRRRIESRARFGLVDWVIAGAVGGAVVIFPKLILGLLYQI
jgi:hypothetical protein